MELPKIPLRMTPNGEFQAIISGYNRPFRVSENRCSERRNTNEENFHWEWNFSNLLQPN